MLSIQFSEFFNSLKNQVGGLAEQTWKDQLSLAKIDGQNFLDGVKANLEMWTQQIASGDLTPDDVTFLLKSQKEYGEMIALKNAGLALVRIEKFRNDIISCIVNSVAKVI